MWLIFTSASEFVTEQPNKEARDNEISWPCALIWQWRGRIHQLYEPLFSGCSHRTPWFKTQKNKKAFCRGFLFNFLSTTYVYSYLANHWRCRKTIHTSRRPVNIYSRQIDVHRWISKYSSKCLRKQISGPLK